MRFRLFFKIALAFWSGPILMTATPRLMVGDEDLARIQSLIQNDPAMASVWQGIEKRVASLGPAAPTYRADAGEQLWQRQAGDDLSLLAFHFRVTGDRGTLAKVVGHAKEICLYPTWGKNGEFVDLPIGHLYTGLGLSYSWAHEAMDTDTRRVIREAIITRGAYFIKELGNPEKKDYWKSLQNHFWVKASGLYLAALAVLDEAPEVSPWITIIDGRFLATWNDLGPDGASHEGLGYWQYGLNAMARYLWSRRQVTGVDGFKRPWFSNTAFYGIAFTTPKGGWVDPAVDPARLDRCRMNVDFADCPRYHWYGPDYLYRLLAREYDIPQAQWMAEQITGAGLGAPVEPWLNLLYEDPRRKGQPLNGLPTLFHFQDMGLVSARSDWGDGAALLAIQCGPALGQRKTSQASPHPLFIGENVGHVHPAAASFCLFADGEWQVPNAGYIQRRTKYENTLLVNGKGQLDQDDRQGWFDPTAEFGTTNLPRVAWVRSTADVDHIMVDATARYPGLKKFHRHFLFAKPDLLVVFDDLEAASTATFDSLFHFEGAVEKVTADGPHSWVQAGGKSQLRFTAFPGKGSTLAMENQEINARHGPQKIFRAVVHAQNTSQNWQHAVAYTWCPLALQPKPVTLTRDETNWVFSIPGKILGFAPKVATNWVK